MTDTRSIVAGPCYHRYIVVIAVEAHRDSNGQRHRLTTDLTVFNVFLAAHRPVDDHVEALTTIRTVNLLGPHSGERYREGCWSDSSSADSVITHSPLDLPEHKAQDKRLTPLTAPLTQDWATKPLHGLEFFYQGQRVAECT